MHGGEGNDLLLDLDTATPDDLYVYGTTSEGVIISGVNDFIYANVFSIENIELRYFHTTTNWMPIIHGKNSVHFLTIRLVALPLQ